MDLQIAVTVLSAAITVGTVISLDRKRARTEGAKAQQFEDMRRTVSRHDKEIAALRDRCMSWDEHETDSDKCRRAIFDKVSAVSSRQDEMDDSRDKARMEDQHWKENDQRWKTNILVYLGRIASKLEIAPINHEVS